MLKKELVYLPASMKEKEENSDILCTHLFICPCEVNLSQTRKDLALESHRPVFTSLFRHLLEIQCALIS